jgi:hypothetical protein
MLASELPPPPPDEAGAPPPAAGVGAGAGVVAGAEACAGVVEEDAVGAGVEGDCEPDWPAKAPLILATVCSPG